MEMNYIKTMLLTGIGSIGGLFAKVLGGWSEDLTTLLIFMAVDFTTGLLIAAIWKKSGKSQTGALNSRSAWKGLIRKGVVLVANRLDITLGVNYIRTGVIIAFIVNEAISIVENLGIMGIPLPVMITKAIDILKQKSEAEKK
jgi:toxin secretion/phage lysis holin